MLLAQLKRVGHPALFLHTMQRLVLAFLLLFCFFSAACQQEDAQTPDDITMAEAALRRRDTGDAEMYFERYLRKHSDGELRWHVWEQLLNISLDLRQDRATAKEYLEIMLVEFENQPERKREIQLRLALLCNELRDHIRAAPLWEALAADPATPDTIKARSYRELAHAYLRRLEFIAATDILRACLDLQVDTATKGDCLYVLGEVQTLSEDLSAAEESFRSLLDLPGIPEEQRVLTVFMLADVLEQQGQLDPAIRYFETIRNTYPNEKVIEIRIANLKRVKK